MVGQKIVEIFDGPRPRQVDLVYARFEIANDVVTSIVAKRKCISAGTTDQQVCATAAIDKITAAVAANDIFAAACLDRVPATASGYLIAASAAFLLNHCRSLTDESVFSSAAINAVSATTAVDLIIAGLPIDRVVA